MLIYFLLLIVVVLCAQIAGKMRNATIPLGIAFLSMVMVAGLRSPRVGTDSRTYIYIFENTTYFDDIWGGDVESGYLALNWLIRQFTDQYVFLFLAISAIVVGCFMYIITRYIDRSQWQIAFFVFIASFVYTYSFNGARQGIAVAIYALAMGSLIERNFLKYTCIVLAGSIFHAALLIALPAYFLIKPESTWKQYLLISVFGILAVVLFGQLVDLGVKVIEANNLQMRYESYLDPETESNAGFWLMVFVCVQCSFFFYFKRYVELNKEKFTLLLSMFYLAAIIRAVCAILQLNPNGLARFSTIFSFSSIFLYVIVFENISSPRTKQLFGVVFIFMYSIVFAFSLQRFSDMVPYSFNPTLFLR